MKQPNFLYILLIIVLFAGCSKQSANPANQPNNKSMCIPSVVATIPDNMGQFREVTAKGMIPRAPMPDWWSPQPNPSQPFPINESSQLYEGLSDIAVRDGIVWVAFSHHVVRYDSVSGKARSYKIDGLDKYVILDLLFSGVGELWTSIYLQDQGSLALAYYNSASDSFEMVSIKGEILQATREGDSFLFTTPQILAESPEGKILMSFGNNILAYDPKVNTASYLLPQGFSLPVAALDVSGNKVWFSVGTGSSNQKPDDRDLWSIDLKTGELVNYGHGASILLDDHNWASLFEGDYRSIAVDKLGRVWMGYFARLTPDQNGEYAWEQVTYPPEFVVGDDPDHIYLWARLDSIYTSSAGHLWFNSVAGLVEYDPEQDTWCKSMPISPPMSVTEDEQGNMWMALSSGNYNAIYKLEKPTTNQ
jgi:hypothetical protein